MEVRYCLTPEDAAAVFLESTKRLPDHVFARRRAIGRQRQMAFVAGLVAILSFYGSWQMLLAGHSFAGAPLLGLALMQLMMFAQYIRPSWYQREMAQHIHGALSRGDYEWIRGDYRLIVSTVGVCSIGPFGQMETRWAGVDRIMRDAMLFMIILRNRHAHIVPCQSFSDGAELERFFTLCNELHREYGQPSDAA